MYRLEEMRPMKKLTHLLTPGLMAAALLLAPAMVSRVAAQTPKSTPPGIPDGIPKGSPQTTPTPPATPQATPPATPTASPAASPQTPTPATTPQEDKECGDLYNSFYETWVTKKDQPNGYVIGKQYIEKCGQRTDEQTGYVKGRVAKFEAATIQFNCDSATERPPNHGRPGS
jgi:hypothetical protein